MREGGGCHKLNLIDKVGTVFSVFLRLGLPLFEFELQTGT